MLIEGIIAFLHNIRYREIQQHNLAPSFFSPFHFRKRPFSFNFLIFVRFFPLFENWVSLSLPLKKNRTKVWDCPSNKYSLFLYFLRCFCYFQKQNDGWSHLRQADPPDRAAAPWNPSSPSTLPLWSASQVSIVNIFACSYYPQLSEAFLCGGKGWEEQ